MSEWLIALEGTDLGAQVAFVLALLSAFLHACFGAMHKYKYDPVISRAGIDICYGMMAAPVALFIVPWPEPHIWALFPVMVLLHLLYKLTQSASYILGNFSLVYPIMRGIAPLFAVSAAYIVFAEAFSSIQIIGVITLSLAILSLGLSNVFSKNIDQKAVIRSIMFAVMCGLTIAAYTSYDAYGVRHSTNPFTFIAWFFFLDGLFFPILSRLFWKPKEGWPPARDLLRFGVKGALIAIGGFGGIIFAMRIGPVGETVVIRETSVIFGALIAWLFLKEKVSLLQFFLIIMIALGAVLVKLGG